MARFGQISQDWAIYSEFWQYLKTLDAMRQDSAPYMPRFRATYVTNWQHYTRIRKIGDVGISEKATSRFDTARKYLAPRGDIPNNTWQNSERLDKNCQDGPRFGETRLDSVCGEIDATIADTPR